MNHIPVAFHLENPLTVITSVVIELVRGLCVSWGQREGRGKEKRGESEGGREGGVNEGRKEGRRKGRKREGRVREGGVKEGRKERREGEKKEGREGGRKEGRERGVREGELNFCLRDKHLKTCTQTLHSYKTHLNHGAQFTRSQASQILGNGVHRHLVGRSHR